MTSQQCPSCDGGARQIGRVLDSIEFAGAERDELFVGGRLFACRNCGLKFKLPRLSDTKLDSLYRTAPEDAWSATFDNRVDWQLARGTLAAHRPNGPVLDIGCWDGRFLESLQVNSDLLYGIEINPRAAHQAALRGVTIVSDDLRSVADRPGIFGTITAFDIIEHVPDPLQLLSACAQALAPGGRLILATGNARSGSFRLLGGRHLYCIWPEHLVFVSPDWFSWAAPRAGLKVHSCVKYRRTSGSRMRIASDWLKNLLYRAVPCLFSVLRRSGVGNWVHPVKSSYPPKWATAKDHFLAVLDKPIVAS